MKVNILGTEYKIHYYGYNENKVITCQGLMGYCDSLSKEIAILNLETDKDFIDYDKDALQKLIRKNIRHEIVHAFLNESGLMQETYQTPNGWAINEEMVDWFALQGEKIYKAWVKAKAI